MPTILSTPSVFGEVSDAPIRLLEARGYTLVHNPHRRKLLEHELIELLRIHRPVGILAGLEHYSPQVFEHCDGLLAISRVGVGTENIHAESAKNRNIRVTRVDDVVSPAVAELAVGLMFDLARRISFLDRGIRQGTWQKHTGVLLEGKTCGLMGFGRIGQAVAKKLHALGLNICYFDPHLDPIFVAPAYASSLSTVDELFSTCDIVSIHLPLTAATRNLVNASLLSKARPGLLLVNTSRGEVVNESDLGAALSAGLISGAALDVFTQEPYSGPLRMFDSVVMTPHIGSYARETRIGMEEQAVANLLSELVA